MKLVLKKIALREDTEKDIADGNIDTDLFVSRIREYLKGANFLIKNKMLSLSDEELYNSLKDIFHIYYDLNDYLRILSKMYGKHYTRFINVRLNRNSNVVFYCAVSSKLNLGSDEVLDLGTIRRLANSNDLVVLKRINAKGVGEASNEELDDFQHIDVNVLNRIIDEDSELFPYAISLIRDEVRVKDILYDIKLYVDEVLHQVKCITRLSDVRDNDALPRIGRLYKDAYYEAVNNNTIPHVEKISVKYHKKKKRFAND